MGNLVYIVMIHYMSNMDRENQGSYLHDKAFTTKEQAEEAVKSLPKEEKDADAPDVYDLYHVIESVEVIS